LAVPHCFLFVSHTRSASKEASKAAGLFGDSEVRFNPLMLGRIQSGQKDGTISSTREQWLLNPCWLMVSSVFFFYPVTTQYIGDLGTRMIQERGFPMNQPV
jgi:hypothetical protein